MIGNPNRRARWTAIVRLLLNSAPPMSSPAQVHESAPCMRSAISRPHVGAPNKCASQARVEIVERPCNGLAILSWRDSRSCCYVEQHWHLRVARHSGVCALTGRAITRGASVFMPLSRPRPLNADEMILAEAMPAARELQEVPR